MTATRPSAVDADRSDDLQRPAMAHVKPLKLLLADDYEAIRTLQKLQLEELGYPTDVVANGEEVLRALYARRYDVVLLDIGMPVMDGFETARGIRLQGVDVQPFLVAVTSAASALERSKIKEAGFDAFIAKPAGRQEFAAVLDEAYAKRTGGNHLFESGTWISETSVSLDLSSLYASLGGAADALLRRVIPVFLRELPGRTSGLRAACQRKDAAALAQICHGLKGASRILGATELASLCEHHEQRAYDGILPGSRELEELLALASRTRRQLRLRLKTLAT